MNTNEFSNYLKACKEKAPKCNGSLFILAYIYFSINEVIMPRNYAIDNVRGLVMIIMALDHVRDIFHETALSASPTDLNTTTAPLFWTRIITHLCAPTFVFLAGVSAAYTKEKTNSFSRYLLVRAAWLIILDFTLIAFGLFWDFSFQTLLFNVLAAIGTGFLGLALLHRLPPNSLLLIALLLTFTYPVWGNNVPGLTSSTIFTVGAKTLIIGYPPLPWLGILLLGYSLKPRLSTEFSFFTGVVCVVTFCVLRYFNLYGETVDWSSPLSFFNLSKYPPSPLFTLLTLGIMFILLSLLTRRDMKILPTFGKVPLFYFITHWYLIHALLFIYLLTQGFGPETWEGGQNLGRPSTWKGVGLIGVYIFWGFTVLGMYPLCRWYLQFKRKHPKSYISKFI
jgi:uncharacterized membrane protein